MSTFADTMIERRVRRRAAFIDRDGVINEDRGYVHRAEDFVLLPGVIDGLRLLQSSGYLLVIITNQAGIAYGLYSERQYTDLTCHMLAELRSAGIDIAGVYHCPHHPTKGRGEYRRHCSCRKPKPGMLLQAASNLCLDLETSVLIGDKSSDIEAGRLTHLKTCVLVQSGHMNSAEDCARADACVPGLLEAALHLTA